MISSNTLRERFLLWINRIRVGIPIRRRGRGVALVLPERHRRAVAILRHGVTIIGLPTSFVAFRSVWVSVGVAAAIEILGTLADKTLFSYTSVYIYPFPDFDIDTDLWVSSFFGFERTAASEYDIPVMGITLADEALARNFHRLFLAWAYGERVDRDRNLRVDVIVFDDYYRLFLYPRVTRQTATWFYRTMAAQQRRTGRVGVQDRTGILFILNKRFMLHPQSSYFPTFRQRYSSGVPVLFRIAIPDPNGQPKQIPGLDDLVVYSLRIKDRSELTRADIQFDLFRVFGD